jgi:hypothetical protein
MYKTDSWKYWLFLQHEKMFADFENNKRIHAIPHQICEMNRKENKQKKKKKIKKNQYNTIQN